MKKLLFLILAALFLAACTTGINQCIDDGFCSPQEKFSGDCYDCSPDLEVSDIYYHGFWTDDSGNAHVDFEARIVNKGVDYEGPVSVVWSYEGPSNGGLTSNEEIVYLGKQDMSFNGGFDISKGRFNQNFNLEVNEYEPDTYTSENLVLDANTQYKITVTVTPVEAADLDESNNVNSLIFEPIEQPGESYSDFLIERDVEPYVYERSSKNTNDSQLESGKRYTFDVYGADYEERYLGYETDVDVATFGGISPKELVDNFLTVIADEAEVSLDTYKGHNVYVIYVNGAGDNDEGAVIWYTADVVVWIGAEGFSVREPDELITAYLDRYPSTVDAEVDTPTEVVILDLELNISDFFSIDGSSYEVELTGGNADAETAVLSVNAIRETFSVNQRKIVNGLFVTMTSIFIKVVDYPSDSSPSFVDGASFTFEVEGKDSSEEEIIFARTGESEIADIDGELLHVTLTAVNVDAESALLIINKDRQTIHEGDVIEIAGFDVEVRDLFLSDIPVLEGGANIIMLGRNEDDERFVYVDILQESIVNLEGNVFTFKLESYDDDGYNITLSVNGEHKDFIIGKTSDVSGLQIRYSRSASDSGGVFLMVEIAPEEDAAINMAVEEAGFNKTEFPDTSFSDQTRKFTQEYFFKNNDDKAVTVVSLGASGNILNGVLPLVDSETSSCVGTVIEPGAFCGFSVIVENDREATETISYDITSHVQRVGQLSQKVSFADSVGFVPEIEAVNETIEAESFTMTGGVVASDFCNDVCSGTSGQCTRHQGAVDSVGTITRENNFPTGNYRVSVKYCDEGDDIGNVDEYEASSGVRSNAWTTSETAPEEYALHEFNMFLQNGEDFSVGCNRGPSTFCRIDTINFERLN